LGTTTRHTVMLLGTEDVMNSASPLMPGTDSALSA
jgi:hypothetical protein